MIWGLSLSIEIFNDEPDPVNISLSSIDDIKNGGYAFHENFFVVDNEGIPEVVDIHNILAENFMFGNDYAGSFFGYHLINIMYRV